MRPRILRVPHRPVPKGYAEGVIAEGTTITLSGQIGLDEDGRLADGLVAQTEQALRRIRQLLALARAKPVHLVRMTWYLVDIEDYLARQRELGLVYRRIMGRHYPAMSALGVTRLVEKTALVEIEATAIRLP